MATTAATDLVEAVRAFPTHREVEHCGSSFEVPSFDIYAHCPRCGLRIKVRAFSAHCEVEDIFDAVFERMNDPEALALAEKRRRELREDE